MSLPIIHDAIATSTTTGLPLGVDFPVATDALTSLVTMTTSTSTAAMTSLSSGGGGEDNTAECRLLGPFALLVQLALGGLALLSLVYKRWRERPQRPVKIWFFDVSKQVFGSVLVHIANVFMSMLTSGRFSIKLDPTTVQIVPRIAAKLVRREDTYVPNPCSFYLLNLAIDTTLGIPILIFLLRVTTKIVSYTPMGKPAESIQSGYYGSPPRALWWLKQSMIYFIGLFGMKICVLILFLILPWISRIGDWALGWTEGNERLQIVFVMMLFPLIMNAMQYYIIDGFIKKNETDHERLPSEDPDEGRVAFDDALLDSDDDAASSEASSEDVPLSKPKPNSVKGMVRKRSKDGREEYNPDSDGHTPTTESYRNRDEQDVGKLLPKELVPPE